eukprot:c27518_g1_i1 orf=2-217(+)
MSLGLLPPNVNCFKFSTTYTAFASHQKACICMMHHSQKSLHVHHHIRKASHFQHIRAICIISSQQLQHQIP